MADLYSLASTQVPRANEGFLEAILAIIPRSQYDQTARLSAVVFFKNRIRKGWEEPSEETPAYVLVQPRDRAVVRSQILQTMAEVPSEQKVLSEALRHIISRDVPQNWPTFLDEVAAFIQSGDQTKLYVGCIALYLLIKRIGYVASLEKPDQLRQLVTNLFPVLLDIGGKLLDNGTEASFAILRVILKIYHSSIRTIIIPEMQARESLVPWGLLFLKVVKFDATGIPSTQDPGAHPVWKSKKWACLIAESVCVTDMRALRMNFLERFAPEIIMVYLEQIEKFANGVWMSAYVRQQIAAFLMDWLVFIPFSSSKVSIPHGGPWKTLRPHLPGILRGFIFPQMSFTAEDQELWVSDPAEYVRKYLGDNILEDYGDPIKAAQELLFDLVQKREKACFGDIMGLTNEIFTRYNSTPKSPLYQGLEGFFVSDVFPEFTNPLGYMRAMACEMVKQFHQIEFSLESQGILFERILTCLADSEMPVSVYAAEALSAILSFEEIAENVKPHIPKIMTILLQLTSVIDTDNITKVMERLTEQFPEQLAPFALDLCRELVGSFNNIMSDLPEDMIEQMQPLEAASGILSTIAGLITAVDADRNIILQLEQEMIPVIGSIFESSHADIRGQCFYLMDLFIFYTKSVSPGMWSFFDAIHEHVKEDEDFLQETLLPLPNYLKYGRETFVQQPILVDKLEATAKMILEESYEVSNRKFGCYIIQVVLLHLRGSVDSYLERFIMMGLSVLNAEEGQNRTLRAYLTEMIISCIYYNPMATLQILERQNAHVSFFQLWFSQTAIFPRVFDKKLMILALCSLLEGPLDHFAVLKEHANHIMGALISTFESYPAALQKREMIKKLYTDGEMSDDEDGAFADEEEDESAEASAADEANGLFDDDGDVTSDEDDEYQDYITSGEKYGFLLDDELSDFEEDPASVTPIDDLDPYIEFAALISRLPPTSASYQVIHQGLDEAQRVAIASIMEIANTNLAEKQKAAA
ncbi:armadillo-type protein [Chytridium lagenaria]|nr:armadillo-type protein [Chytridium lagenaria]